MVYQCVASIACVAAVFPLLRLQLCCTSERYGMVYGVVHVVRNHYIEPEPVNQLCFLCLVYHRELVYQAYIHTGSHGFSAIRCGAYVDCCGGG